MNAERLYSNVVYNIWNYWDVVNNSSIYERTGEARSYSSPGSDYDVELNGDFKITIFRARLGTLSDEEWEVLTQYVKNKIEFIYKDSDFEELFVESIKGLTWHYNKNKDLIVDIDIILSDYIKDEFYKLDFIYDDSKWVLDIGYC